ncbi:zinc-dependent alcohol dehydrogenase family protein [Massilia sp. S19_KUP03_FR1]|uniref:zinc-dependent alcohol dehydrogenase family protein n=1 Tax=Massilia sp. S19_KUP03_FR1 TaxID=3025503 RepID=UPI002FCD8E75
MSAMVLNAPATLLRQAQLAVPRARGHDILLKVGACGVCRTDLRVFDGELPAHLLPLVPGHEIVGKVVAMGDAAHRFRTGQRVGVPWLAGTCRLCAYCRDLRENLCAEATFTGYDRHGGFADYTLADERYCFALPDCYDDVHAAPLLCAGLIGYRAYAMVRSASRIGLYGFGAAAHILTQLAVHQGREIVAFTRPGDVRSQHFALSLGASWAGASNVMPPAPLDAAIIFAPDGALVPPALASVVRGGTVVCAGIHMSDIPAFPYALLWGERTVANLTRADGEAFFALVSHGEIATVPVPYRLDEANDAVAALRAGKLDGAAVLVPTAGFALAT